MLTLREVLLQLKREPVGSILLEDNAGSEWQPSDLLLAMESDDEGRFDLTRAVTKIERGENDLDSVIAFVSPEGYEYPNEPRWYVRRPRF